MPKLNNAVSGTQIKLHFQGNVQAQNKNSCENQQRIKSVKKTTGIRNMGCRSQDNSTQQLPKKKHTMQLRSKGSNDSIDKRHKE